MHTMDIFSDTANGEPFSLISLQLSTAKSLQEESQLGPLLLAIYTIYSGGRCMKNKILRLIDWCDVLSA